MIKSYRITIQLTITLFDSIISSDIHIQHTLTLSLPLPSNLYERKRMSLSFFSVYLSLSVLSFLCPFFYIYIYIIQSVVGRVDERTKELVVIVVVVLVVEQREKTKERRKKHAERMMCRQNMIRYRDLRNEREREKVMFDSRN